MTLAIRCGPPIVGALCQYRWINSVLSLVTHCDANHCECDDQDDDRNYHHDFPKLHYTVSTNYSFLPRQYMNRNGGPPMPAVFTMGDRIPVSYPASFREALQGVWQDTPLSSAFFSEHNIAALQKGIQDGVHRMSKGQFRVGMKDDAQLKEIMRNIFIVNSRHSTDNIARQVQGLNDLVLRQTIREVYSEAEGYIKYRRDSSKIAIPLAPPMMTKSNDKQLLFNDRC